MQYGGLRSLVTCMTTYYSNDSFASPRIEPINRWIKACGMLLQSGTSASRNSCSVAGGFWPWRTRVPISSHKCSIGDRSGDNAGQGKTIMLFWKTGQTRATWHLSLSCWKTWSQFRCCRKGRTIASRICILWHSMFREQYWTECDYHEKFQPTPASLAIIWRVVEALVLPLYA